MRQPRWVHQSHARAHARGFAGRNVDRFEQSGALPTPLKPASNQLTCLEGGARGTSLSKIRKVGPAFTGMIAVCRPHNVEEFIIEGCRPRRFTRERIGCDAGLFLGLVGRLG